MDGSGCAASESVPISSIRLTTQHVSLPHRARRERKVDFKFGNLIRCKVEVDFESLMTIYSDEIRDRMDSEEVLLMKGLKEIGLTLNHRSSGP
jgi:hypothetical protein